MTDSNAPSTLPVVKANLVALMKAAKGYTGVTVDYGDPGVNKLEREHVFLGGTGLDDQKWAPYGQLKRQEDYQLEHYVHVAKPGSTQQEVTERAYALAEVTAQLLRPLARTPTQLGAGVYKVEFLPRRLTEFVTDQGYAAFLFSEIAVMARI